MNKNIVEFLVLCSLIFCFAGLAKSNELDLSDEKTIKETFVGKSLNCWMEETNYNGPILIETKSVNGRKFKGQSEGWCHQTLTWKGKLKKNRMKLTQVGVSAQTCYCRTGYLDFVRGDDGTVTGVGKYKVGCGATPFQGELSCKVE